MAHGPGSQTDQPIYRQLDHALCEIRLVKLLPADNLDAPLQGRLEYHALANCPNYEALSYAWGSPEFTKHVDLDGHVLHVTPNLDAALRHIRLASANRLLWVDAICINQQDLDERSHQVTLMKNIYRNCTADLLWIGPNPSESQSEDSLREGIRTMERISSRDISQLEVWGNEYKMHQNHGFWAYLRRKMQAETGDGADPEEGSDDDGPAGEQKPLLLNYNEVGPLRALIKHASVWGRIWVMQEISCAPRIVLVAGRSTLDWELITQFLGDKPYADAFHGPFSHGMLQRIVSSLFGTAQTIDHQRRILRDAAEGKSESTLLDVLSRFSYARATDPRDKIYGLLGLISGSRDIEVSYTKPVQQLYTSVTALFVNEMRNLDIICQSPWRIFDSEQMIHSSHGPQVRMEGLPSWAADFRVDGSVMLFAQRSIFNAGRPECAVPCRTLDGNVLYTRGVLLGRIGPILQEDYLAYGVKDRSVSSERYDRMDVLGREWMDLYFGGQLLDDPQKTYINGESAFTAFWRTLVTDRVVYPAKRLTQDEIATSDGVLRRRQLSSPPDDDPDTHVFSRSPFEGLPMEQMWTDVCANWTFVTTDNGLYAMIQPPARQGDVLACLDGGKVPVVLRPRGDEIDGDVKHQVVSVAYVHGFMDMEAYESTSLKAGEQEILLA